MGTTGSCCLVGRRPSRKSNVSDNNVKIENEENFTLKGVCERKNDKCKECGVFCVLMNMKRVLRGGTNELPMTASKVGDIRHKDGLKDRFKAIHLCDRSKSRAISLRDRSLSAHGSYSKLCVSANLVLSC
jgi:hypothetical protein